MRRRRHAHLRSAFVLAVCEGVCAGTVSMQLPSPTGTSPPRVHSSWIFCPSPDSLVDSPSRPAGILCLSGVMKAFSLPGPCNRPNSPMDPELCCCCGWHGAAPWSAGLGLAEGRRVPRSSRRWWAVWHGLLRVRFECRHYWNCWNLFLSDQPRLCPLIVKCFALTSGC